MENTLNSGTINIQLSKLNGVNVVEVKGQKCVSIPIDSNGIYVSDKGTIYLSFFMSKMKEKKWDKTHCLKRKLTKEEYANWTKEQKEEHPVLGYFEPLKPRDESGYKQKYYSEDTQPEQPQYYAQSSDSDDLSGLPF